LQNSSSYDCIAFDTVLNVLSICYFAASFFPEDKMPSIYDNIGLQKQQKQQSASIHCGEWRPNGRWGGGGGNVIPLSISVVIFQNGVLEFS